jgi:hypothetical protein
MDKLNGFLPELLRVRSARSRHEDLLLEEIIPRD